MGQMRFLAPQRDRVTRHTADRAYLAGMEGIPWQSLNRWENGQLTIERSVNESGNLYIPWKVDGYGEVVLSTASLMERPQPYHLPVELARGALHRLRNQTFDWEAVGLQVGDEFRSGMRDATQAFIRAATSQRHPEQAAGDAEQAIRRSLDCMELLSAQYSSQALAVRHHREPRLATLLAGNLGDSVPTPALSKSFLAAFNSAVVPLPWYAIQPNDGVYSWETTDQQLKWCQEHKLTTCCGPLLQTDATNLPDWIYLWEEDFDDVQNYVWSFVEQAVTRYQGRVHLWHCAARMNVPGGLGISEEQKLRLVVGAMDVVRRFDKSTPVFISFDQPWGEYLARQELDLSPLHFADALVRADVGLSGIAIELNWGYWPGGTQARDVLELNRQVDRWSALGLPLLVILTIPSSHAGDDRARSGIQTQELGGLESAQDAQQLLVQRLVPLLLAKPAVHGVIWNQFCDARPHEFPHGGLLDARMRPKPALKALIELREQHLV